jgi:hypothetical protein
MTDYGQPDVPTGVDSDDWATAIAAIRAYCGWHIAPSVTETVTVDGPGTGALLLPTLHLTALGVVNNDGTDVEDCQWSDRGVVRRPSGTTACGWTTKLRGIQANITHGYDVWPGEVLGIAKAMASQGIGSLGARITSGPHSIDLTAEAQAGAMSANALHLKILDRYRIGGRP